MRARLFGGASIREAVLGRDLPSEGVSERSPVSGSVRLSSTGWGPFGRNAILVMLSAASPAGLEVGRMRYLS